MMYDIGLKINELQYERIIAFDRMGYSASEN